MSDNSSNKHRAVNIICLSDKEIKKYQLVKADNLFLEDDLISLYEDQYVKISKYSKLLKYKIHKDATVYRRK